MKVIFEIPIIEKDNIFDPIENKQYTFDEINIEWDVDSNKNLNYIKLIISGIPIEMLKELKQGNNEPTVLKLKKRMFSVISYIANRILIQKGRDIVDLDYLRIMPFNIYPETPDEEKYFPKGPIEPMPHLLIRTNIISKKLMLPDDLETGFKFSEAFANYADGLRALSTFLRYEQFYKGLAHFCEGRDKNFCTKIRNYVIQYDNSFTTDKIKELRDLRNRITHPKANHGHLNPSDMISTREVESALPLLKKLVEIILKYAPQERIDEKI